MARKYGLCLAALLLLFPGGTQAQHSPYVSMQSRAIKALAPEDVENLRSGAGMGYALAAELNGFPGPRHVLELNDSLNLTAAQHDTVQAIFNRMQENAIDLGLALIQAEAALDSVFSTGTATPQAVRAHTRRAADLEAQLRATHLVAHLEVTEVLTMHQRHRYTQLRGYGDHEHGNHRPGPIDGVNRQ